jgi:hypothetical protein
MKEMLPTFVGGNWSIAAFRNSLFTELKSDVNCDVLYMFFYAVTTSGWNEARSVVTDWQRRKASRSVKAYIGTDHGITDPNALAQMLSDGVRLSLLKNYSGIFHPKVVWLCGQKQHEFWVASNNLTRDGLANNIEFAVHIKSAQAPPDLVKWSEEIDRCSVLATEQAIASYRAERNEFEKKHTDAGIEAFTWSEKGEAAEAIPVPRAGDLVMEIMPRETGTDGKQVQIPKKAARTFFNVRNSRDIPVRYVGSDSSRLLRMTVFGNDTVRLSLNELEYRDRPCLISFSRDQAGAFEFEIISRSISPQRYRMLLELCTNRTRAGSRRWCIIE